MLRRLFCLLGYHAQTLRETTATHRLLRCPVCGYTEAQPRQVSPAPAHEAYKAKPGREVVTCRQKGQR